jgi:hypothetical protein
MPPTTKPVGVPELLARTKVVNDCWMWTSTLTNGYGVIGVGGRSKSGGRLWLAHRLMYELAVGPLPQGMVLHHTCHEPACLNPDHLEPMSRAAHQRTHRVGAKVPRRKRQEVAA